MIKANAVSKKPAYACAYEPARYVKFKPLYYLAAFLIPALLTFIAYVIFGVYPFGERSVLTLDLNGQYVYYFENIRRCFWEGESILYSWARNLSGGYQGVIGYYLASPFTFIVILMPRSLIIEALMIMQICKVGACGVAFCAYAQNSKNVKPLQSVIFSTMYALMAYVSIQLIDPMWIDGPIFLPLIILGVEYLIDDGRKINYIIPLAIMFIANFYIGFMVAIFVALYFVYYLFFGAKRKFKGIGDYAFVCGRMVLATGVALMCSYIMIVPIYNALALGKFDFSEPDYSMKTMFNPIELLPTLFPNQYYSVNVDEGTRMYGRPEIYCGVLSFVLSVLYFFNNKIRTNRKIGHGLLLFVMFFSMWIKPLNMMWHGGQDPNWLPYRYSFLISFILVSMAAETFSKLDGYKMSIKAPMGVFGGIALLSFVFEALKETFNYNETDYKYVAINPYKETVTINGESVEHIFLGTLVFGVILSAIYLTFVYLISHTKSEKGRTVISVFLAALVFFEAGYNIFDTIYKIDQEVYYSSKDSYSEIMSAPDVMDDLEAIDDGFYRAEKTFFRNVNDNQAYGLKGVSHSSSVMNARILTFLETLGYTTKSYESRYDGNTPLADSLLGIKYVIDDPSQFNPETDIRTLLSPHYNKVGTSMITKEGGKEQQVDIYENPDALPIAFMADDDILRLSFLGNDNPFNSMNNFLSSMTGNTPDYTNLVPRSYFYRLQFDPVNDVELNECTVRDYNGQFCYDALPNAVDPTVRVHFTSQSEDNLYIYLKSDNQKKCNLWLSTTKNEETGEFEDFTGLGSYFDGYDNCIINLGSFPVGTEIELRMTIIQQDKTGANEFIMIKDYQFYYFDYDLFHEDIQKLKESPLVLDMDKTKESRIVGEVDAKSEQIFYTSIPYEPGWTIKVDGKKVEQQFEEKLYSEGNLLDDVLNALEDAYNSDTIASANLAQKYDESIAARVSRADTSIDGKLDRSEYKAAVKEAERNVMSIMTNYSTNDPGSVCILNAMYGLRLEPGHHEIEMTYAPPGFKTGVLLFILGIAAIVVLWYLDRKNNPALLNKAEAKANWKKGIYTIPEPAAEEKKPVKIIKSKGAVAEVELTSSKSEESEGEAEKTETTKKSEAKSEEKPEKKNSKGLAEELYGEDSNSKKEKKQNNNNKNNSQKNNNNKNNQNKNKKKKK